MNEQIPNKNFPYPIGTRVSVKSPYIKKLATIVGLSYNSCACMQYEIKFDGEDVVVHYPTDLMTPVNEESVKNNCPFCDIISKKLLIIISKYWSAFEDEYPVSPGHCLIVPQRHVESMFELTDEELKDLYAVIVDIRNYIKIVRNPDGFNIGVNEGRAAGQTVPHLHIHVIPRYNGDMEDPRGGVRGVIPEKQKYSIDV